MSKLEKRTAIALCVMLAALKGQTADAQGKDSKTVVDETVEYFDDMLGAAGFEIVEKESDCE